MLNATEAQPAERYTQSFDAGQMLYRAGDSAEHCYFLRSGRVRLVKQVRSVEQSIQVLRPGDVFGLEALVGLASRGSLAIAIEDAEALALDLPTVERLLLDTPDVTLRLVRQLVRRVHAAEERVENHLFSDPSSRIVHSLLRVASEAPHKDTDPHILNVTPLELSSRTGLSVDETKAVVRKLRDQGYIRVAGERLEVPKLQPLQQLYELLGLQNEVRDASIQ